MESAVSFPETLGQFLLLMACPCHAGIQLYTAASLAGKRTGADRKAEGDLPTQVSQWPADRTRRAGPAHSAATLPHGRPHRKNPVRQTNFQHLPVGSNVK